MSALSKYLIIKNTQFDDWNDCLGKNDRIYLIKTEEINKFIDNKNYRIMPLTIIDNVILNHSVNNIFFNNIVNLEKMDNKSKFAQYMLDNFPNNTPPIYYYNDDNQTFINNINISYPIIAKPNKSCAGNGIEIFNEINYELKEHVVQKYITHLDYYCGHFLIINGCVIYKIYFKSQMDAMDPLNNKIKCGRILNYETLQNLEINDNIFNDIFFDLNYSGFACVDFIINENNIIIFEINPRPGGSLIHNVKIFNICLDKLDEYLFYWTN